MMRVFALLLLAATLLGACINSGETDVLREELARVQSELETRNQVNTELDSLIESITVSLDAIDLERNSVAAQLSRDKGKLNRTKILERISEIYEVLQANRDRILLLEEKVQGLQYTESLKNMVRVLKRQLADRERELSELSAELQGARAEIVQLASRAESQQNTIETQLALLQESEDKISRKETENRNLAMEKVTVQIQKLIIQGDEEMKDAQKVVLARKKKMAMYQSAKSFYEQALSLCSKYSPDGVECDIIVSKINTVSDKLK